MNESVRLARQLDLALHGGAWHGPSWKELVDGIDFAAASRRPIPDAHTVAEVAGHVATWNEVVRLRLNGESPDVEAEQNWPEFGELNPVTWESLKVRLFEQGVALRETIAAFPPERLHEKRPTTDGTWYELILGQLQHVLYHAGQAAVLMKGK